jgi:hypothetical protein
LDIQHQQLMQNKMDIYTPAASAAAIAAARSRFFFSSCLLSKKVRNQKSGALCT